MSAPVVPPTVSINEERAKPQFSVRELTYYLDGGKHITDLKERISLDLERDPAFTTVDTSDLSLEETRERTMRKIRRLASFVRTESINDFKKRMELVSILDPASWTRLGVHYGLFFGALRSGCSPSQFSYWCDKGALTLDGLVGCFGMTELGHGSNVAGLETTATFDEKSDEFIINTPTLTATKWWIGGAAHTASHCIVFAQLWVKGKCYGVKNFVVQLRDTQSFELLQGIAIGDIGPKMGRHGIDNGWIQFSNVRIPRSHMLMKHAKVSRSGVVTEPPLQQLTYGALISGRVSMVVDSGNIGKKALTIALRYAVCRRQFGSKRGSCETKLLDYLTHQYRLIPLLAQTYAMIFTGIEVNNMYECLTERLESLQSGSKELNEVLELLKEMHGTSSGLKPFCTWTCLNIIDQARQSLGGHGYSSYNSLASTYNDFVVHCTWEGDNTILTLQAGRYLVSSYRDAVEGKTLAGGIAYLNTIAKDPSAALNLKSTATTVEDIGSLSTIEKAFHLVAGSVVKKAYDDFNIETKKGLSDDDAYEATSHQRLAAAKMHCSAYLFFRFKDAITHAPNGLKPILTKLCQLYGLHTISENSGPYLQYGFFTGKQMDLVRQKVQQLITDIRPQSILLVDAFNLSDFLIQSPFGRYDGNIYEYYMNKVLTNHTPGTKAKYFNKEIKPIFDKKPDPADVLEIDDDE